MTAVLIIIGIVAAGWAVLTYGAASMHPAPSQTNLESQMLLSAGVALVCFVVAIISFFVGG